MLSYEKKPESDIAEIVVDGKISDEEMNAVITAMKSDLGTGRKLRLLEDVRAFEGMEPAAFFKDPRFGIEMMKGCLLYTSPSPRDRTRSRMPSSA